MSEKALWTSYMKLDKIVVIAFEIRSNKSLFTMTFGLMFGRVYKIYNFPSRYTHFHLLSAEESKHLDE